MVFTLRKQTVFFVFALVGWKRGNENCKETLFFNM